MPAAQPRTPAPGLRRMSQAPASKPAIHVNAHIEPPPHHAWSAAFTSPAQTHPGGIHTKELPLNLVALIVSYVRW